MDDNILRIMITTDNHLGYLDKDLIRCDDSFAAFEEGKHSSNNTIHPNTIHPNTIHPNTIHPN